jgi:hypothetical protein
MALPDGREVPGVRGPKGTTIWHRDGITAARRLAKTTISEFRRRIASDGAGIEYRNQRFWGPGRRKGES